MLPPSFGDMVLTNITSAASIAAITNSLCFPLFILPLPPLLFLFCRLEHNRCINDKLGFLSLLGGVKSIMIISFGSSFSWLSLSALSICQQCYRVLIGPWPSYICVLCGILQSMLTWPLEIGISEADSILNGNRRLYVYQQIRG